MFVARMAPPAAAEWPRRLRDAIADPSGIGVAFQPIVDLARGTVVGYEALARFPDDGPEAWFGAARLHGLADHFEAAVLSRTLATRADTPPNCFISINASPGSLLSAPVQAVLAGAVSLEATVIEITEQTAVSDYDALGEALDALRARGAALAVDDAGAGYASLSHVMRLRPDFVKLDRGLVSDCDVDEAKLAALEMLGGLVGRIDGWVIAEGVERPEELDALLRVGIPLAQGYHLARPAAGMHGIAPGITAALHERARRRQALGGVSALVETVPVAPDRAGAAARLADQPETRFAVIADNRRRPLGLLRRQDGSGAEPVEVMVTDTADAPAAIALRAMTRAPERRFDPLVCCDGRGQVLGIVPVERLVGALAQL